MDNYHSAVVQVHESRGDIRDQESDAIMCPEVHEINPNTTMALYIHTTGILRVIAKK